VPADWEVRIQAIDFLFLLPLWALAVVLNVWLMGFALVSLWALRRWALPRLRLNTDATLFFGAAVMQSAMVLYGLVAALTAVSVWTKHSQALDTASREATAIASLWRNLGGYPERERESMREVLRGYTNQIIQEAWPEQRQGRIPRGGVERMDRFLAQLLVFEPTTESQKLLHAETLSAFNRMHEARRQRLDAVNGALPSARRNGLPAPVHVLSDRGHALPRHSRDGLGRLRGDGALRDHQSRPPIPRCNGHTRGFIPARLRPAHEKMIPLGSEDAWIRAR
jgi:hypothetical protein